MAKPLLDESLWAMIEPMLPKKERRFKHPGRKRVPDRACLTGILFVLLTGIQWEMLPQEMGCGCGMTCWRPFPLNQVQAGLQTRAWIRRIKAMGRKRHSAEEIVNKLRPADVELAKGQSVAGVCKLLAIMCGRTTSCRHGRTTGCRCGCWSGWTSSRGSACRSMWRGGWAATMCWNAWRR